MSHVQVLMVVIYQIKINLVESRNQITYVLSRARLFLKRCHVYQAFVWDILPRSLCRFEHNDDLFHASKVAEQESVN